jgi:hypothetical protein
MSSKCHKRPWGYTQTNLHTNDLFNPATLDTAYLWLCKQRSNFPANADIWHLRFHRHTYRRALLQILDKQDYPILPLCVVTKADGETFTCDHHTMRWS